jgi:hypothetical protein
MKSLIYKNLAVGSLAIHSLWLFAAAMALAIQPVSAQAQSYKRLYSFTKDSADGQNPSSSLLRDPEGNLYGIALGGTYGEGIVFELSNPGEPSNTWQESVVHSFNQSDGDGYPPTRCHSAMRRATFLAPPIRAGRRTWAWYSS